MQDIGFLILGVQQSRVRPLSLRNNGGPDRLLITGIIISMEGKTYLKSTTTLLPVICIATLTNFVANLLFIPGFGTFGAAWASVITFATYSFYGLWRYRRIDRYNYPLLTCAGVLFGMAASYVAYDWLIYYPGGTIRTLPVAMLIWMAWFVILFWGPIRKLLGARTWPRVKMPLPLQEHLR